MSRETILVTGVGGGVGQSILKCLQDSPYDAVGADGDTLGTGLYAVAKGYRIPYANSPTYVDRIAEIGARERCRLLFPGLDAELTVLANNAQEIFHRSGMRVVVSSPEVIEISDDKWATVEFLVKHNFPAPRTVLIAEGVRTDLDFPLVLKPKTGGARSRGVYVVRNEEELRYYQHRVDVKNYVAQEYIEGAEYTCGTLTFDGTCRGAILLRRVLRDGDTYKAFVEHHEALEAHVRRAAESLRPFGPCNFQLRVRDGMPYILEINARCSGTTFCRALAGVNEPVLTADYLLHGNEPRYQVREISIFRYWKELVVENAAIARVGAEGYTAAGSQL